MLFRSDPYDPSPYSPASRLAWNEFYLDVEAAPELAASPEAREMLASPAFRQAMQAAASSEQVDYQSVMSLKRQVLEALAAAFFTSGGSERRAAFDAFLAERPHLADYARFRAAGEHLGRPWQAWPDAARAGTLASGDWNPSAEQYHL